MFPGFTKRKHSTISNGDWDRDGVINRKDCEPLNFRKQDTIEMAQEKMYKQGAKTGVAKCPFCGEVVTERMINSHLAVHR